MRAITSLAFAFGVIGSFAITDPLQAQSWPQRPVRLIVPLPAGTAVDVSARVFGEHLSAQWKQPVIVENILGVDGVLATKEFAGRTDNHTLLYSFAGPITINPVLYEKLPYDPNRDLVPIAMSSDNFLAIAASEKTKARSLGDLVKLATGQAQLGSYGRSSLFRVCGLPEIVRYRDGLHLLPGLQSGDRRSRRRPH
jgi:tripartite-type tricarboxylate transporter receptor subunit TctC